jgi:hypothetical protein
LSNVIVGGSPLAREFSPIGKMSIDHLRGEEPKYSPMGGRPIRKTLSSVFAPRACSALSFIPFPAYPNRT